VQKEHHGNQSILKTILKASVFGTCKREMHRLVLQLFLIILDTNFQAGWD